LTLEEEDRRVVALWAAACAERVLPLFTACAPDDTRPQEAIEGVREFARGEARIGPVRALAVAAHAAARSVDDPAAVAAARAAGHAAAVAHMASHALGAPAYAAQAVELAAPNDPAAAAAEIAWATQHAPDEVRSVLRRLPRRSARGGALGALIYELDIRLTAEASRCS
jgi:hypothetical protein